LVPEQAHTDEGKFYYNTGYIVLDSMALYVMQENDPISFGQISVHLFIFVLGHDLKTS